MRTIITTRSMAIGLTVALLAGCAPRVTPPNGAARRGQAAAAPAAVPQAAGATAPTPNRNLERLAALQAQRQGGTDAGDYRLGPGDVLSVRAYDLDELNQRVRVDGDGNVVLPLLNSVSVRNRTVAETERDLTERLGTYMYNPKVTVFIDEYRSQQVAVVGAVQKPGVVAQTNRTATVLDAIAAAGGKTGDASSRIYLIPAETRVHADAPLPATGVDGDMVDGDPIVFDGNEMSQQAQARFLSLPVKGGDVVVVPGNGHFVVEGWVEKPGAFPMQSGLTLRGAIATAGGLSFPAESSDVRIFRQAPNGTSETVRADLDAIAAQRAPDVFLHEGDVIEIDSSKVKLVSYGAYKLVTDLVKVGARITPF